MAHPKETLRQEPCINSEDLEKHRFLGKYLLFQKISGQFHAKKLYAQNPTWPESPLPLNVRAKIQGVLALLFRRLCLQTVYSNKFY